MMNKLPTIKADYLRPDPVPWSCLCTQACRALAYGAV